LNLNLIGSVSLYIYIYFFFRYKFGGDLVALVIVVVDQWTRGSVDQVDQWNSGGVFFFGDRERHIEFVAHSLHLVFVIT